MQTLLREPLQELVAIVVKVNSYKKGLPPARNAVWADIATRATVQPAKLARKVLIRRQQEALIAQNARLAGMAYTKEQHLMLHATSACEVAGHLSRDPLSASYVQKGRYPQRWLDRQAKLKLVKLAILASMR